MEDAPEHGKMNIKSNGSVDGQHNRSRESAFITTESRELDSTGGPDDTNETTVKEAKRSSNTMS